MEAAIRVKNLKKHFGATKAVDGISFEVQKGEIFGFLGPNGAGKTTTIRAMMDFIRPTTGEIEILGKDSQEESVYLKEKIGFLANNAKFYDYWTVRKHLDYQQGFRGKSKILGDLLKRFGLNPRIKFKNLSSGNRQKLSIILALMNEPELLILDEPTVALDPLLQNSFHQYIKDFAKAGGTVFMSSHNLSEVERVCDRVGIIRDGKMVAIERISEMKLMKMYDIHLHTAGEIEISTLEAEGAEVISHTDGSYTLKVKKDINPILKKLATLEVKDLEITHVSLEDIFMEFYQK